MQKEGRFIKERSMLTLWYCGLLLLILVSFSLVLYTIENQNFTRIVIQRDFGAHLPQSLTRLEKKEIRLQAKILRQSFAFNLIAIDIVILLIGGGLSYLLAGITLAPIQDTLTRQKEFLADASHELRTPLAAIRTACEVALRSERSKDEYKKVIQQAYEESTRLSFMSNDLLTLSRIDANSIALSLAPCNISEIITQAIDQVTPLAKEKNLTINYNAIENVSVYGDKNRLKQLLLILLDNAIKYTPTGAISVTVTTTPRIKVAIADGGIGIARKDQEKIFERFYRVDKVRGSSGTGLGLSIASWIVRKHNATIKVESTEGKGSTFSVTFPHHIDT